MPALPAHDDEARRCLAELRGELAASYPAVSTRALLAIARRYGLDEFPAGFLVAGRLARRGADGARAHLAAALRGESGHPLFSPQYYGLTNPDVAAAGVAAWAHYQRFGRAEGRSPHPLIDPGTLGAALTDSLPRDVVDDFLGDRRAWFVDPGPYADVSSFVLSGRWSGSAHPTIELASQLDGPWVHSRLMLVDSRSSDDAQARLVAGAYLLTRGGGRSRLGRLRDFETGSSEEGLATVVPGFLLARGEIEVERTGTLAVSPDGTAVRIAGGVVALAVTAPGTTTSLTYVTGTLARHELAALVRGVAATSGTIAPVDRAQEIALRQLRRDLDLPGATVLEYGVQVLLDAGEVRVVAGSTHPSPPERPWSTTGDERDAAVALRASQRRRATGDPLLRAFLAAGASLCLVDDAGLNTWLPVLQSRALVVCEPELVGAVGGFVERDSLRLLPASPEWPA